MKKRSVPLPAGFEAPVRADLTELVDHLVKLKQGRKPLTERDFTPRKLKEAERLARRMGLSLRTLKKLLTRHGRTPGLRPF